MATIAEVIAQVDDIKPNLFTLATKIGWLNEVEGMVQTEVMLIAPEDIVVYGRDTGAEVELLVRPPHDKIYRTYLSAMIDFANGEYNKYQNTMQLYNTHMDEYMRWYALRYRPADGRAEFCGYYLSAYGIAVKHGFAGSEEDWLEHLHGADGASPVLRYDAETGMLMVQDGGGDGWNVLAHLGKPETWTFRLADGNTVEKAVMVP